MRRKIRITRDTYLEVECNTYGVRRAGRVRLGTVVPLRRRLHWWAADDSEPGDIVWRPIEGRWR